MCVPPARRAAASAPGRRPRSPGRQDARRHLAHAPRPAMPRRPATQRAACQWRLKGSLLHTHFFPTHSLPWRHCWRFRAGKNSHEILRRRAGALPVRSPTGSLSLLLIAHSALPAAHAVPGADPGAARRRDGGVWDSPLRWPDALLMCTRSDGRHRVRFQTTISRSSGRVR